MESRFDDLARALGGGIPRREALRRIGLAAGGTFLGTLVASPASAQPVPQPPLPQRGRPPEDVECPPGQTLTRCRGGASTCCQTGFACCNGVCCARGRRCCGGSCCRRVCIADAICLD